MAVRPTQSLLFGGKSTPAIRAIFLPLSPGAGDVLGSRRSREPRRADGRSCTSCKFSSLRLEPSLLAPFPNYRTAICSDTQCGHASDCTVKAPQPPGRPEEFG